MTGSSVTPSDGHETRQDLLLRRLAEMLYELRRDGVFGPCAFEDLIERRLTMRKPRA